MTERPRVIVADDDASIRQDFGRLIEHDGRLQLVGAACDGLHAVQLVQSARPDVVLMDLRMPRLDGVEATRRIVQSSSARVLVITVFDVDRDVLAAIRAGASGFLLKHEAPEQMIDAALAVVKGDQAFNPTATAALVEALTSPPDPEPADLALLTPRELETLELVATGKSNEEIARLLYVSMATVKSHVRSILGKIGATNRTQAVVWAYEHRIVRPA